MHINLTLIAAIWMGGLIALVPLLGAAARFGLVPVLDSLSRLRRSVPAAELDQRLERLERRMDELVEHLEHDRARPAS